MEATTPYRLKTDQKPHHIPVMDEDSGKPGFIIIEPGQIAHLTESQAIAWGDKFELYHGPDKKRKKKTRDRDEETEVSASSENFEDDEEVEIVEEEEEPPKKKKDKKKKKR